MSIQLIWANNADGTKYCLFTRPMSFDVEKWAESRRAAFRILNIVGITVEEIKAE
jgi:hypothetical protein